jgi:hypothetical protein
MMRRLVAAALFASVILLAAVVARAAEHSGVDRCRGRSVSRTELCTFHAFDATVAAPTKWGTNGRVRATPFLD